MAIVERHVCDICGSNHKVEGYAITVARNGDLSTPEPQAVDLCPRHHRRLLQFVERGMTPPSSRGEGGDDAAG